MAYQPGGETALRVLHRHVSPCVPVPWLQRGVSPVGASASIVPDARLRSRDQRGTPDAEASASRWSQVEGESSSPSVSLIDFRGALMTLPFTRDEFFDVFAAYNQRLWPFAVALWMLTAYSVVLLIRTRSARPWWIPELLAIHWAWAGLAYHAAFFSSINPAAWVFSGLFVLEAGLLLWYGVVHGHLELSRGRFFRRVLSWALIVYALLYPAIALAEGHAFPRLPTFGVPCPTTILTIGFLLAAGRSLPRIVAVIPLVWAFIAGSSAFLLGVRADLMLLAAGIVLAVAMIWPKAAWLRPL